MDVVARIRFRPSDAVVLCAKTGRRLCFTTNEDEEQGLGEDKYIRQVDLSAESRRLAQKTTGDCGDDV